MVKFSSRPSEAQAGENRESSTRLPAGVQIRVDKEEYIDLRWAAATGRPSPRKRSSGKRICPTMKMLRARIRSWKAVCTAVEA